MMTNNEREMFIQLMQAVNMLARAVEYVLPEMQNEERRRLLGQRLGSVDVSLTELIQAMDKEWFPNE